MTYLTWATKVTSIPGWVPWAEVSEGLFDFRFMLTMSVQTVGEVNSIPLLLETSGDYVSPMAKPSRRECNLVQDLCHIKITSEFVVAFQQSDSRDGEGEGVGKGEMGVIRRLRWNISVLSSYL